jgi:hypothetical protein
LLEKCRKSCAYVSELIVAPGLLKDCGNARKSKWEIVGLGLGSGFAKQQSSVCVCVCVWYVYG